MDVGIVFLVVVFGAFAWWALKPKKGPVMVCPTCEHHGPAAYRTKGSMAIEIVLWLLFIVPGLIYSLWRPSTRRAVCAQCGAETLVPPNSPVGQRVLAGAVTRPAAEKAEP